MAASTVRSAAARAGRGFSLRWVTHVLIGGTVATCFRYRVTGLAAEAGFFALLSLPPLIFGLVGTLGYLTEQLGAETVSDIREQIQAVAETLLASDVVQKTIMPTLDSVLDGGVRFDVISLGFLLALWSGSRALNVYVDTITIMYGLSGRRGIVRTRILSFSLYLVALVLGVLVGPLALAGPSLVDRLLPEQLSALNALYWPVVLVFSVAFLTTLYHVSIPANRAWWRQIPGAVLALGGWLLGGYLLRWLIGVSVGGTSIYGPLAAPIVVLIWLYLLSLAVLIGAALNASLDRESASSARDTTLVHPQHAKPLTPLPSPEPDVRVLPDRR